MNRYRIHLSNGNTAEVSADSASIEHSSGDLEFWREREPFTLGPTCTMGFAAGSWDYYERLDPLPALPQSPFAHELKWLCIGKRPDEKALWIPIPSGVQVEIVSNHDAENTVAVTWEKLPHIYKADCVWLHYGDVIRNVWTGEEIRR